MNSMALQTVAIRSDAQVGSTSHINSPFGALFISTVVLNDSEKIRQIGWLENPVSDYDVRSLVAETFVKQLERYYDDPTTVFTVPTLALEYLGSPFRQRVWEQIAKIPSGKKMTYGQLATMIRSSPRAVGQACGDNPLPFIIPCHRVIGALNLGGFAHHADGLMLTIKRRLLERESVFLSG